MSGPSAVAAPNDRSSWTPMIVIAMGQALMSFNVAAIPVSMSGMVKSFETPPTTVGVAIIMYSLGVSGFVMLGAKLGQRFGSKIFFQAAVLMFLCAMVLMVVSPRAEIMLLAQGLAGLAGAALVPSLVALIANHYRGDQQAQAVGWLGSARAIAGVLAFVTVGFVAAFNWRLGFGLLILHAAAILVLSFKLKPSAPKPEVKIDVVGVFLAAIGIILIIFGFNNIRSWGALTALPGAPFDLVGVSPAPMFIVAGVVTMTMFFLWSFRREAANKTPLLALQVVSSPREWATVAALFLIVAMEGAINFSVPLYIQIVQGRSSMQTSFAMMPFMLTVFFTAILVVRLYNRFSPRQLAFIAYIAVSIGMAWLAFVIHNDWSTIPVIIGLVIVGIGQGALVTLLFNVLVTASPKELAGDVGSLRGVTQNMAAAVGTAVVGAVLVGLLGSFVLREVDRSTVITPELAAQVDLSSINFVGNDRLRETLAATTASPEQVEMAVRINENARLRSLKTGFIIMSGIALLALLPCSMLPSYKRGEIPPDDKPRPAPKS
ncbi:MAG: MFS transporter [Phycisphaerae bacterium]|nr:MFS transporter [Phycisphaerae bacterium]